MGVEAPKLEDFAQHLNLPAQRRSRLPIQQKPVIGSIKYPQLLSLSNSTPAKRSSLIHSLGWCNNSDGRYEDIASRGQPTRRTTVRLPNADVEIQLKLLKFKVIDDILHGCNIFTVIEAAKQRRRLIVEPLLNDWITKQDLLGIELPSKGFLRDMATKRYFLQLDASSFFDQFSVTESVMKFLGISIGERKFAYTTLPMGFRPSCDVAQSTAEFLLDFEHPTVLTAAYIDNFIFAGDDKEKFLDAVSTFRDRCSTAGVILNDDPVDIHGSEIDVLGEHYSRHGNPSSFTRSLTSSSCEKLQAATKLIEFQTLSLISRRQMAAVFGILFFASGVLEVCPAPYFYALRAYREMAAETKDWDSTANRLSSSALHELRGWLQICSLNTPIPIVSAKPIFFPSIDIIVDASAWGCGAVISRDGKVTEFSRRWSLEELNTLNLKSSVVAEPRGVESAVMHTLEAGFGGSVRIHTDHMPLVYAASRGFASCFWYNKLLLSLRACFPNATFEFVFIPGHNNPADRLSRGWQEDEQERRVYGNMGMAGCRVLPRVIQGVDCGSGVLVPPLPIPNLSLPPPPYCG